MSERRDMTAIMVEADRRFPAVREKMLERGMDPNSPVAFTIAKYWNVLEKLASK
jgi:hypothetical protein